MTVLLFSSACRPRSVLSCPLILCLSVSLWAMMLPTLLISPQSSYSRPIRPPLTHFPTAPLRYISQLPLMRLFLSPPPPLLLSTSVALYRQLSSAHITYSTVRYAAGRRQRAGWSEMMVMRLAASVCVISRLTAL